MEHGKQGEISNPTFSMEIVNRPGGETLTRCYQCGTCASSCPVAKVTEKFNPREVIRKSLLGEKEEVLSGDSIWLCSSCYNCQERCPQKVEIADVIYALRNAAMKEGNIPNIYSEFIDALIRDGRIVPISKFLENKRPEVGLPPLKPAGIDSLKKILSATGFDRIKKEKEES